MKVAYLVNVYPAGSHTFIRREIHALERRGIEVDRIALRGWKDTLVDAQDQAEKALTRYILQRGFWGLLVALMKTGLTAPRRVGRALRLAWRMSRGSDRPLGVHIAYLCEACVVVQWLKCSGAGHLHAHFATNPAEIAMLARALGGPPYSFTAHGSDIMDRPAQVGLGETVARAAFAVAVCSFGRSQIYKWVPQTLWDRVHVVRCGLRAGYGRNIAPPTAQSSRLLCVGRLSKEKGQLLLVMAAKALADAGIDYELVLAGDGPMRQEIEALAARLGLSGQVRITGWLDAGGVEHELAQARALVVPSLSEGLPVVIMEAMAAGRPVIAPYLAGIPELVGHRSTGWLFPAGDTASLASAMRRCLLSNESELLQMSEHAREEVWKAHDVDIEAGKLATLFRGADTSSPIDDAEIPAIDGRS